MKFSAVILAGGGSRRFNGDKGLALLGGKPLVSYVVDAVQPIVHEVLVVVSDGEQARAYEAALGGGVEVILDAYEGEGPLVGALTGLRAANWEYTLLLPCDTPFLSRDVLRLLLEICIGVDAVVPRWPNGYIEPLQAAYHTERAADAADEALRGGSRDLRSMVSRLRRVRYISTEVLKQLDQRLLTFTNINSQAELARARSTLKKWKTPQ